MEKTWLEEVTKDLTWVYNQIRGYTWLPNPLEDPDTWHLFMRQHPARWKKLITRASRHAVWQHRIHYEVGDYHRRALVLLQDFGMNLPSTTLKPVEHAHYCFICARVFKSYSGWAVHSFKLHSRINKWRRLQTGHTCLACAKVFPSSARLTRHLQSVKACAATVASANLWVEADPAFGSAQVTREERTLALHTWDYSNAPTMMPANGWTTTQQTWHVYRQYCNMDWRSPDNHAECLRALQEHAVCHAELLEIQAKLLETYVDEVEAHNIRDVLQRLCAAARPAVAAVEEQLTLHQCVEALQHTQPGDWPAPQPLRTRYRYILHLFSGVRRPGDIHSTVLDLPAPDGYTFFPASIDIALDSKWGDLTSRTAQQYWIEASMAGAIFGTIGGPPCESWSISRWRYFQELCGPRPIRDGMDPIEAIWALCPVRLRDLFQLDVANQLLLFILLITICQAARRRCAIVEHPACPPPRACGTQPPSIWLLPIVRFLCRCRDLHEVTICQGFWGAASPKPTTLLIAAPDTTSQAIIDQMNKYRTRTSLPPPLTMGRLAGGTYRTAPLKRYTPHFCRALGSVFQNAATAVSFEQTSEDPYYGYFSKLKQLYLQSSDGDDDGNDYVPKHGKHGDRKIN